MSKRNNFPWTEEELELLRSASKNGEIPVLQGRSRGAVLLKMNGLGLRKSVNKFWTEDELNVLRSSSGIPELPGRNRHSVRAKMKELGLIEFNKNWSEDQIEELRSKLAGSESIEIEGRSKAAILKKIYDLGLMREYLENRKKLNSNMRWSESELELVKKGRLRIKGRSRCAVIDMRRRLGMGAPRRPRPYWTAEKERLIKSLHSKGLSARDMVQEGHFVDRSAVAVQKKLCRMGLAKKMELSRLPKKVNKVLLEFVSENWKSLTPAQMTETWNSQNPKHKVNKGRVRKSMREIGVKLRFSMPVEVRDRLKKFVKRSWSVDLKLDMKLANIAEQWNRLNPENQVAPKRIRIIAAELLLIRKKMPDLAKLKLRKFLSEKWEGRTTDELVDMWNIDSNHKTNKLMVSRILNELNLKIDCFEVRKMNNLRTKEKEIISAGAPSQKIMEDMIRAERVKLMSSRFGSNKDIFTGMRIEGEEVLSETI